MNIFFKFLLSILSLIVLVVIFVVMYFKLATRVGSDPQGERADRIEASQNSKDGKFQNRLETNMDIPVRAMAGVVWKMLTATDGRSPGSPLPTVAFDRSEWEDVPDTSFAIAWFGHSTVLIKLDGLTIMCDPVFSDRASAFTFAGPKAFPYEHTAKLEDLPRIDLVLLTHDHYDHLDYESILYLKDKVDRWLTPLGVGAHLEYWGVKPEHIQEYDWWSGSSIGPIDLKLVPSRHFSGRGLTNRFSTLWGGLVIKGRNKKILFGGDSGYSPTFAEIGRSEGPFDLVFLECGAYNELWNNIHMFPEEVAVAANDLGAKALIPIHWGKFDLAL
ncbi:MAG: MBL fold metallo-hydrolase, partial [Bacteroidota bacterium]|nr:MBL fold metallo-hydrolase [Bacteroidota bacterium]